MTGSTAYKKRAKFPLDLVSAVAKAIGPFNVAIRLEPTGVFNHTRGTERVAQAYADDNRLSYVHLIEPRLDRIDSEAEKDGFYRSWSLPAVSNILKGTPTLTCGGWGSENHNKALEQGWDAVVFAKWFVSNPDLPARLKNGAPLHAYDRSRFVGSSDRVREAGYTDYPTEEEEATAQ
ncbi:flavin oxidoreductase hxnT [Colletotrichum spaethianum]|uniref:Flavin oxidoreductase hxnT n=1 Tax=Colletotrichum spaethianum TaxID=700344 RepID=A0AA37P2C6_9PEZI|nr:flavin oxidoreductase hxnT [Colletotrichum spaethianum]GKT46238.1 flavin oxidoreductase hxnT [Colletotrichum spaethianum]